MPRPCCVSCRRGSHTITRFTRTRLSDIVHPVSSLRLTDLDRVRSFGGYNIRLRRAYRGLGRQARLCAASRQETSNVNVTVGIHVGPDDRRTIAVRLGYNC